MIEVRYQDGGVLLPELALWLDAGRRQLGPERVFVSHAHSDHARRHREVILTRPTARFMEVRGIRPEVKHELEFGCTGEFLGEDRTWQITPLPAGHIVGSAMGWLESNGHSLLYTGDFKLRSGRLAEPCEPRQAEVLIMETTFGRPQYRFPTATEVWSGILAFCRQALDTGETPVLLTYSLGKGQEVLHGLADLGLSVALHEQVYRLTRACEQLGYRFPPYHRLKDARSGQPQVVIGPPNAHWRGAAHGLGRTRTAVLTGWAMNPGCRYQWGCDAAFPLSDHADFDELLDMVRQVNPARVYTLHGFAADFAGTLRERGWDARALSEPDQLNLVFGGAT